MFEKTAHSHTSLLLIRAYTVGLSDVYRIAFKKYGQLQKLFYILYHIFYMHVRDLIMLHTLTHDVMLCTLTRVVALTLK